MSGMRIAGRADQRRAAEALVGAGAPAVLLKGGHGDGDWSQDYFFDGDDGFWLSNPRRQGAAVRGTGCVLSSAIAAFVAHGKPLRDAVVLANAYVQQGLKAATRAGDRLITVGQRGWPASLADFPRISADPDAIELAPFPDCGTRRLGLYPIVDSVQWLEKLLPLGVQTIQLRIKDAEPGALDDAVVAAVALGRQFEARLFINDHWESAIRHDAYGVHLGQQDLDSADLGAIRNAGLRLGISTHSEYEWARAVTLRPSYIALGTVFVTQTKPARVVGTQNLRRWAGILGEQYALTAIGGIKLNNIESVLASGVGSVAVATAITDVPDYAAMTTALAAAISHAGDTRRM